jgi:hypothetical protein
MRNLTLLAVEGKLNDGYFELPDNVDTLADDARYLRARVEGEEDRSHQKVKIEGRTFLYKWNPDDSPSAEEMNQFLERVAKVLKHTRGQEAENRHLRSSATRSSLPQTLSRLAEDWRALHSNPNEKGRQIRK